MMTTLPKEFDPHALPSERIFRRHSIRPLGRPLESRRVEAGVGPGDGLD